MTAAQRPVPAVLAVVRRGDALLLVQRGQAPDLGLWGFPGGKIEWGEALAAAAARELAEETGVAAEFGPLLDCFDARTPDGAGGWRFHYVLTALLGDWRAGDGQAGDDAAAVGWFTLEEIRALPRSARVDALAERALASDRL